MSETKKLRSEKTAPSAKKLVKLPAKKARQKKQTAEISINITERQRNLQSTIELLKRSFKASKKTSIPTNLKPMLATITDQPFSDSDWQFELKLDGYRSLAYLQNSHAELRSRNNLPFNKKFAAVATALAQWNINAVLDGEIVVLNEEGLPDFSGIQQWTKKKEGQLVYYVFDLLWLDGLNIMNEPLHLRRAALKQLVPEGGMIRFSDHIDEVGEDFFELVRKNNLEGIIAKLKNAPYIPDSRSKTWLKIKAEQRHEAIICGYTKKHDTDRVFSSLVLGIFEKGQLQFIGQTGTGFTIAQQKEILKRMKPQLTKKCPFATEPQLADEVVWLKPFLVCEVKYTELTKEGVMRHASFQGLRIDKTAAELNDERKPEKVKTN